MCVRVCIYIYTFKHLVLSIYLNRRLSPGITCYSILTFHLSCRIRISRANSPKKPLPRPGIRRHARFHCQIGPESFTFPSDVARPTFFFRECKQKRQTDTCFHLSSANIRFRSVSRPRVDSQRLTRCNYEVTVITAMVGAVMAVIAVNGNN